jgi:Dynamin family
MDPTADQGPDRCAPRKPCLALMGEFSAGKSTLTNMLLGTAPLPTRVTATQLPPVRISHGDETAYRIDRAGNRHALDEDGLQGRLLQDTAMIRLFLRSDTLELCDLIDFPGISDPNMPADIWQGALAEVDSVIWCTHATQAWRRSESAAWAEIATRTNGNNLLLVTQTDKLRSARDRDRVMARVTREAGDQFAGVYPVSLLQALNAGDDQATWIDSGAAAFTEHLVEMLLAPAPDAGEIAPDADLPGNIRPVVAAPLADIPDTGDEMAVLPRRVRNRPGDRLRTRPVIQGRETDAIRRAMAAAGDLA